MTQDKKIKVRFCPKCKSFRVRYVRRLGNLYGIMPKQKCLDCGFEGIIFPTLEISELELRKKVNKIKTKQTKKKVVKKPKTSKGLSRKEVRK